jgi:hypothetical protein
MNPNTCHDQNLPTNREYLGADRLGENWNASKLDQSFEYISYNGLLPWLPEDEPWPDH